MSLLLATATVSSLLFQQEPTSLSLPISAEPSVSASSERRTPMVLRLPSSLASCAMWEVDALTPLLGDGRKWRVLWTTAVSAADGTIVVTGSPKTTVLLLLQCDDAPGYLLDGPYEWPEQPATRSLPDIPRRTVRGNLPATVSMMSRLAWVSSTAVDAWPMCTTVGRQTWECIGLPVTAGGVVVFKDADDCVFAVAPPAESRGGIQSAEVRSTRWGRLLQLAGRPGDREAADIQVSAMKPRLSRWRPEARMIPFEPDPRVTVTPLGRDAFWVAGSEMVPGSILQIEGPTIPLTTLPLDGWESGLSEVPYIMPLEEALSLEGRVSTVRGAPASGSLVSIAEPVVVSPAEPDGATGLPRRWRLLAETNADADGRFSFSGLGRREYEISALHPTQGRVTVVHKPAAGEPLLLRLRPMKVVTGGVVQHGNPAPGIAVKTVPELRDVAGSTDASQLFGAQAVTDESGRFLLALPPRGNLHLVVGTSETGIVRRVLGPAERLPAEIDVGIVSLPGRTILFVRIDGWDQCGAVAVGPFGASGMTVLTSTPAGPSLRRFEVPEPGRWLLSLDCGGREIEVSPPYADVPPATMETVVHVTVPSQF